MTRIKHRVEVSDGSALAATQLEPNDLGVVNLATNRPVPFAPFDESRELGGFILIDRTSNATVAAGTITFALMRAANLKWQDFDVTRETRAEMKLQSARCLWLTGLSASGKSTIANLLEKRLVAEGLVVIVAFISPFQSERDFARSLFEPGEFLEILVDASLEVCARRDPKGLYAKALRGGIRNFTGVDSPYERPERPDLCLNTGELSPEECVEMVLRRLD